MSSRRTSLPTFVYHRDPVQTGAIEPRQIVCAACGEHSPYAYLGPVFADDEIEQICPWCIEDGQAAAKFDAEFVDATDCEPVADASSLDLLVTRTPGFAGWQQERWLSHCGDFCTYIANIPNTHVKEQEELIQTIDRSTSPSVDTLLKRLSESHKGPLDRLLDGETPYRIHVFECRHCGIRRGYVDYA
ncbi:CbrC family protein [Alicyclobacillus fastidiosus]|uniref:CbrC family protein n=1 Tax=Alicyclobacillus fastidiosus TaxID=392011 RepID=A0ABY6ZBT0_9BACL|nr:CbrC family protein [Alicyclobacillus fastidiosus]WAH40228.1 CbrC family protein [Alicyclobacillus fastidiosus]GMA61589.1 UPF0167 protein [Alicyclobacillus fastidiosus]